MTMAADGADPAPADHVAAELGAKLTRAEHLARALDKPMGILGVVFLFVVLAQLVVTDEEASLALTIIGWAFWLVFVAEFLLRAYVAHFQRQFWLRNWWQVIFLLVPFLRFFRALQALRMLQLARVGRVGGVVSAGVRGTRSAGKLVPAHRGWVAAAVASRLHRRAESEELGSDDDKGV
jgi:voltage-gated potassium channel